MAFDSTWTDSLPQRGKGFNPFMRHWHFARSRWAFPGADLKEVQTPWKATALERSARQARQNQPEPIWEQATPPGLPLIGGAGRVNRVVVHPENPEVWLACAPSGGAWITSDSGEHWSLMGSADWAGMGVSDAAFHPSDPHRILLATGDGDFGSAYGIGLMASDDGGASWTQTGLTFALSATETVNRVHRKSGSPGHILAATSDGVWLSEDDGNSFVKTLEGQCSDLLPHPGDSAIWHAALRPGEIFRSTDGGRTWTASSGLLSAFSISRYTLATSEAMPNEVWAIGARSSTQGLRGVYKSVDHGATFTALPDVPNLLGWTVDGSDFGGQGFYDLSLAVDPTNPEHIVAGGVNLWETFDGGANWSCSGHWFGAESVPEVHADHHAVSFLPGSADWVSAHDGGVTLMRSGQAPLDRSEGLEVGQIYRFALSERRLGRLLSGWQDNGVNFLSESVHARIIGADGFHCLIHPEHPDTMYAAEYFGKIYRSTDAGWSWTPWTSANGTGVNERGDWDTPMAFAPNGGSRTFVAKHRLYWTDDEGDSWSQTDALPGAEMEVLALSPAQANMALVARGQSAWITHNLSSWSVLSGLPDLPITDALLHPHNEDEFWISLGGYEDQSRVKHTQDGGQTWTEAGQGLPALPVNVLAFDTAANDLYAGTDAGVYLLPSGSSQWTPYKDGLPEALCSDLHIRYSTGELLLSTYGRGLWKAPLHVTPDRDAAAIRISGASPKRCGELPRVGLVFQNTGADTLISASVIWNGTDTLTYGFVLPPHEEALLPWEDVLADDLPWGAPFQAIIHEVVGASGNWSSGSLTSGVDAVPGNDAAQAIWGHRSQVGPVLFHTMADCRPLESAWSVADSAGHEVAERQHFPPEMTITDTLCMTHGCHELTLFDQGGDGWEGSGCGMSGTLDIVSIQGGTVWPQNSDGFNPDFGSGQTWSFCLPVAGLTGCTDPAACNFNPAAAESDESCDHSCPNPACPGDLDGDGIHGATDILAVLSEFGCNQSCTKDITGDGAVSANDVLSLLALYGAGCPD